MSNIAVVVALVSDLSLIYRWLTRSVDPDHPPRSRNTVTWFLKPLFRLLYQLRWGKLPQVCRLMLTCVINTTLKTRLVSNVSM